MVDADEKKDVSKGGNVGSAISVITFLAESDYPTGVNAIARSLSMAPSSCFRILKQLQAVEFAEFDEGTKCYTLGCGAAALARRALDPNNVFRILRSRLESIVDSHEIAIGFWRLLPRDRLILAGFVEGRSLMRIQMTLGQRLPMLVGAVGRAFAAELCIPDNELKEKFEKLRWNRPLSFEEYRQQVMDCKQKGYAVDRDNFSHGVTTVAVALRNSQTASRYGLSAIMFSGPQADERTAEVGEALLNIERWASSRI